MKRFRVQARFFFAFALLIGVIAPANAALASANPLTATTVSPTEVDLSWDLSALGSSGSISRCEGVGCSPTTQIASGVTGTFHDTNLIAGTTYHYQATGTKGFLMTYGGAPVVTGVTYNTAGAVAGVTPSSASTAGGTSVTLAGYALGNAGTVSVSFGASAGTNVSSALVNDFIPGTGQDNFPYQVTVTSPSHAAGAADVAVTTSGGTSTVSNGITFISAVSVSPTSSVAGTATSFTVSCSPTSSCPDSSGTLTATGPGTLFNTFGINPGGPSGCSVNPCSVTTLASAPAGTYTVILYGNSSCGGCTDGTQLGTATFTVNAAIPVVSGISPSTGRPGGNTTVTVTGSGFTFATAVTFGGTAATFTVNSDTSITTVSPAGKGQADVVVTAAGGTSATSPADLFTYATPFAVVGKAGTSFKLSGANFDTSATPSVVFTPANGVGSPTPVNTPCAGQTQNCIQKDSAKSIIVRAPSGPSGLQVVSVVGADTGSAVLYFDYGPAILKVTKSGGAAGTTIVIKGGNFGTTTTSLPTVTFGGIPLPGKCSTLKVSTNCIASASNTSITVKAPQGTASEAIGVTAVGGLQADDLTALGAQFSFGGAITSVSPQGGAGGTMVHIKGQGFGTTTPTVTFGGFPLASSCTSTTPHGCIKSSTASNITVVAPDGLTGEQSVNVTTATGDADDQTPAGAVFAYGPAVTSVSPLAGPATTTITIKGVNLGTVLPQVTIGTSSTNTIAKCSKTVSAPCIVTNNATLIKVKPLTTLTGPLPITVTVGTAVALNLTNAPLVFNFGADITGLR